MEKEGISSLFKFSGFEDLSDCNLKNGDPVDARPLVVKPAIPEAYHWAPIGGLAPEDAVTAVDVHVSSQLYQMASHPDTKLTEPQRRKAAIVLGVSRAVMTKYYRLRPEDFIGGELAGPYINAWKTQDEGIVYTATVPVADPNRHILITPVVYTEEEKAVVVTLLMSSLGTLPLQGYSLIMTGHQYISDASSPSRKAFAVVEKQFWRSAAVREYFASDMEILQDVCWHKAGHPVSMSLKQEFAFNESTAVMLKKAGVGSAAARLPAMEPQIRAASSYVALMDAVAPLFERFDCGADAELLSGIIRELKAWRRGAAVYQIPAEWPETIKLRTEALSWLGDVLQRIAPKVAYCYGFYCALTEQTQTMAALVGGDTLRTSYYLSKLRMNYHDAYLEGTLAYADFAAARNRRKMEGEFTAVTLTLTLD